MTEFVIAELSKRLLTIQLEADACSRIAASAGADKAILRYLNDLIGRCTELQDILTLQSARA